MNAVMNSEEQMLGYMEFTNANMAQSTEIQPEIGDREEREIEAENDEGESIENIMQDLRKTKGRLDSSKLPAALQKPKEKNAVSDARTVNTKVMENWLNQTLSDAEHLDIPGCILRPEHKNPITRYGIDRIELTNWGIPEGFVDRIYRCLFVYSVGFYEMVNKVIEHSA
jgi:hypothetical protein